VICKSVGDSIEPEFAWTRHSRWRRESVMADDQKRPSINEANAVSFLARHLVSLTVIGPKVDEQGQILSGRQMYGYSGFVIEFLGEWFFLTAGHVLNEIRDTLRACPNGEVRLFLQDSFGIHATTDLPVQMDLEHAVIGAFDDDQAGVDIGIIRVSQYYRAHLQKNQVIPVDEATWRYPGDDPYDFYGLLGFPEELTVNETSIDPRGRTIVGGIRPTLVRGTLSKDVSPIKSAAARPWLGIELTDGKALKSIRGMSGGPVFGFRRGKDSNLRYWVIAVQSWWDANLRIAYSTRIREILDIFAVGTAKTLEAIWRALRGEWFQSTQAEMVSGAEVRYCVKQYLDQGSYSDLALRELWGSWSEEERHQVLMEIFPDGEYPLDD
jgi:hypothetical protein